MSGSIGFFGQAVSDELSLRVGRLIVLWATLGNRLNYVICTVAGLNHHDGQLFTARLDLRLKTELVDGLLRLRHVDDETRGQWSEMMMLIMTIQKKRNLITHGIWLNTHGDDAIATSTRRGKPPESHSAGEFFTVESLDRVIADAQRLLDLLSSLRLPKHDARLPSPDR